MSTYGHPGVYVRERVLSGAPSSDPSVSTAVFVAPHGRGPLEPAPVRTWSEFVRIYGGFPARTSLLPYALFNYFNNGGTNAVVLRVVGTGVASATVSLDDRDAAPAPTLNVTAKNPGNWGNNISIGILDAGGDRFELRVHFGGTGVANIVERFTDLSMDPDSARYVEAVINSASTGSAYVTVSDQESSGTDTRPALTAETPVALVGGNDGDTPSVQDVVDSIDELEKINQTFVLNFPGDNENSVIDAALAHCESSGRGFLIVDSPPGATPAEVVTYADSLSASSYGAIYYPWARYRDPAGSGSGATRSLPPGGAVAGIIAATDVSRGVWKAPAGTSARISGAVSLERTLSDSDLDTIHAGHVNAVRHIAGSGINVMGARTLKRFDADKYIPIRRSLIHLRRELLERTRWAAFEPNDSVLWGELESRLSQFLTGYWQEGGLQGQTAAEAFFVNAGADIQTNVESGEVRVEVGVALRYPAEFVIITLSQWEGGSGQAAELTTNG